MNECFFNNVKLLAGEMALENLPFEISSSGAKKPMLLCDEISNRLGYLREVYKVFNNNEITFNLVVKNLADTPSVFDCERLTKLFRSCDCDCIVAVGKYSAIATAKCIKLLVKDGSNFLSTYKNQEVSGYSLMSIPLFVVPTGLGCGFETCNRVRIPDTNSNIIYELNCNFAQTNVVICDIRMVDIMPPQLIVESGVSSFARAIIGYGACGENFVAESYLIAGIKMLTENFMSCLMHNAQKMRTLNLLIANVIVGIGKEALEYSLIDKLSFVLADRYRQSISKMYLSLFPFYVFSKFNKTGDLSKALLYLKGEDEYAMTTPKGRIQRLESTIREFYNRIGQLTDFDIRLSSIGVKTEDIPSIIDNYLSCNAEEKDTRDAISELLTRAI